MATAVHIPVSEYLCTTYRPDGDYVDGEVLERNPATRECWKLTATDGAIPMLEEAFTLPGTLVRVAVADIFEEIEAAPKG